MAGAGGWSGGGTAGESRWERELLTPALREPQSEGGHGHLWPRRILICGRDC